MDAFLYVCLIQNTRPIHRLLRQGVYISGILQMGCESEETHDFGAKTGCVHWVSSQNPHDFEIICPGNKCSCSNMVTRPQKKPSVGGCVNGCVSIYMFNSEPKALTQAFETGGANFRYFTKGVRI